MGFLVCMYTPLLTSLSALLRRVVVPLALESSHTEMRNRPTPLPIRMSPVGRHTGFPFGFSSVIKLGITTRKTSAHRELWMSDTIRAPMLFKLNPDRTHYPTSGVSQIHRDGNKES